MVLFDDLFIIVQVKEEVFVKKIKMEFFFILQYVKKLVKLLDFLLVFFRRKFVDLSKLKVMFIGVIDEYG